VPRLGSLDLDLLRLRGADRQVAAAGRQLERIAEGRHPQHFHAGPWDDPQLHQPAAKRPRPSDLLDYHCSPRDNLIESEHQQRLGTLNDNRFQNRRSGNQ